MRLKLHFVMVSQRDRRVYLCRERNYADERTSSNLSMKSGCKRFEAVMSVSVAISRRSNSERAPRGSNCLFHLK
jgi:hypothetical protein